MGIDPLCWCGGHILHYIGTFISYHSVMYNIVQIETANSAAIALKESAYDSKFFLGWNERSNLD